MALDRMAEERIGAYEILALCDRQSWQNGKQYSQHRLAVLACKITFEHFPDHVTRPNEFASELADKSTRRTSLLSAGR
jgi:hypothetical protein